MESAVTDEDLDTKPPAEIGNRCGNCRYGKMVAGNVQLVECYGNPPVPTFLGMGPGRGPGQMVSRVEALRPQMPRITHACRLWEFKGSLIPIIGQKA